MESNPFREQQPHVVDNVLLRTPQRESYKKLLELAAENDSSMRELGIVLPVGCGKSGCISLTPFAFRANRTLVVAPGVRIANQLLENFDPAATSYFYDRFNVLEGDTYPQPVEIRGTSTNRADLDAAHVVVTNIQQLQGEGNRWLEALPSDFFDLIVFDEGHHNTAESWTTLKDKFPDARIVNYSATPLRADGQRMAGNIVYSFPVARAIEDGYVKQIKGRVLNPKSLRYVRRDSDKEIEVPLEEVIRLGEQDADFRRSIVTSSESLATIADASIQALRELREESGDKRLKIIASALNYQHCLQVVSAYESRGMRAAFVHSRQESPANERVFRKLENHELDVIVQVRKLGEGFDHPYLAVAAIFSVFINLSPFVQFVGRIMRVIVPNEPAHVLNRGVVVFHAGANIIQRWKDFQEFSEADQEYFGKLLPLEGYSFGDRAEIEVSPTPDRTLAGYEVKGQDVVELEELTLIEDNPEAMNAINTLNALGYSEVQVAAAMKNLKRVRVTKVRQRQAKRSELDSRIRLEVGKILAERQINPQGRTLDSQRLGRSNYVVLKSAIDRQVNTHVGQGAGQRHEFTMDEHESIDANFTELVARAVSEVFGGAS